MFGEGEEIQKGVWAMFLLVGDLLDKSSLLCYYYEEGVVASVKFRPYL